jgi:DNA repair exonuclease SbcCD nuclease subunit
MKIAIISDLHVSTRMIGPVSVLDQSIHLSKKLVSYCKDNSINTLFIAGDIIDKAMDRPEVMFTVKDMFKLFSESFDNVYYILGQHDTSTTMNSEVSITDSIVNILDYPNVHYMNGKLLELGNCLIGFHDFSRHPKYPFDKRVNLYITHFTISTLFGQSIDNSKFDLMIAGDIHKPTQIGNEVAIGSFQQQSYYRDDESNNVVIYDTESGTYSRINIGGGILIRSSQDKSGLIDGVFYVYKRRPQTNSINPLISKFKDDTYLTIVNKVSEFMESNGLSELNDEIKSKLKDTSDFSTNFELTYFKVHNFRKIRDFEVNFDSGDKILLTGDNGSGKSTFLISLYYSITGEVTWNTVIGHFDSEVWTEVGILYQGNNYKLRRGSGNQSLSINGTEVVYKNRNDFTNIVRSNLPFITDISILFQKPEVGNLFEHTTANSKLGLVSKIYHLEYLDNLCQVGTEIKKSEINKLNQYKVQLKTQESQLDDLNKKLSEIPEFNKTILGYELFYNTEISRLTKLKEDADKYRSESDAVLKLSVELSTYNAILSKAKSDIDSINLDEIKSLSDSLNKRNKLDNDIAKFNKEISELTNLIKKNTEELNSIKSGKCPRCNQSWVSESAKSEITKLENSINDSNRLIITATNNRDKYIRELDDFESKEYYSAKLTKLNSLLEVSNSMVKSATKKIDELNKKISQHKVPKFAEFTENDLKSLLDSKDKLALIEKYKSINSDISKINSEISVTKSLISSSESKVTDISNYVWYVCKSGPIYKDILDSLCESWSNDNVKFSVYEGKWRGQDYLDLKISYLKGTNWQDYSESSSGEKSYMDIMFIKSVTANSGMLILDEFLRHMSNRVTELALDEIRSMNNKLFILSSFNPNLYFANKYIRAQYIPESDECKLTMS